ncbi:FUSC family protein [Brevibacterium sp. ZH18]|uniref:FUSC family protein n=1 Tax=Brevibacterium sp. ZH18 TaxID=2927784 RepID=UPI001F60525E|nr:FUSC family protein [Brevibacterium sp. ZH18]MCI4012994.1 FUSC family protein [Brevibacterium sp. ZH18]
MAKSEVNSVPRRALNIVIHRVRMGLRRVQTNFGQLIQIPIAATAAYTFCVFVLGHPYPFLAAVASAVGIGPVADRRLRRALEIGIGATFGVLVGEILVNVYGSGIWQLAVTLSIGLFIGTMLNSGGIFITQIAVQSVYVIVVPASASSMPFPRTLDALAGSMCAILLALLIPRDARKVPRGLAANMLDEISAVLEMMSKALRDADVGLATRALTRARETQDIIDSWGSSLKISREAAKINARGRRHSAEVTRLSRAHTHADRAMRTIRVIARRVVGITEFGVEKPIIAGYVGSLSDGSKKLEVALRRGTDRALAEAALAEAASSLDPRAESTWDIHDESLVLLLRPVAVDLLEACGLTNEGAQNRLPSLSEDKAEGPPAE